MIPFGVLSNQTFSTLLQGLVSWWELDETTGIRLDSHGTNHRLEVGTVGYVTGKQGNAAHFDKENTEYLECNPQSGIITGDNDWSYSGWVRFDSLTDIPVVFAVGNGGTSAGSWAMMLYYNSTNADLRCYINAPSTWNELTGGGTLSTGTWYHIVLRHDTSTSTLEMIINNGTPVSYNYTGTRNSTNTIIINRYHNLPPTRIMDGDIDEEAWWNRKLSDAEVSELFNSGNGIQYSQL